MFEDPQAPQLPESADEPAPGMEPSQQEQPSVSPSADAYVPPLYQNLPEDDDSSERSSRRSTSGLIRRITGSLRRATGSLRGTGALRTLRDPSHPENADNAPAELSVGAADQVSGAEPQSEKPQGSKGLRKRPSGTPSADAYAPQLRQNLLEDEQNSEKTGRRTTGELIRRITGSLRRVTGSLRGTGSLRSNPAQPPQESEPGTAGQETTQGAVQEFAQEPSQESFPTSVQPEIEDDFLSDRLGGATVADPLSSPSISLPASWPDEVTGQPDPFEETAESFEIELEEPPALSGDEPISLLDNDSIAAEGMTEEAEKQAAEPDWMAEIRQEAAQAEAKAAEPPVQSEKEPPRGLSGPLVDFINKILYGSEGKRKPAQQPEGLDDLPADRLEQGLGTAPDTGLGSGGAAEPLAPESDLLADHLSSLFGTDLSSDEVEGLNEPSTFNTTELFGESETRFEDNASFLEGLEARFDQFGEEPSPADSLTEEGQASPTLPGELPASYELFPDEETLLWDNASDLKTSDADQATTDQPDQVWDPGFDTAEPDISRLVWGEEAPEQDEPLVSPRPVVSDDEYAAAYLTGSGLAEPSEGAETLQPEETLPEQVQEQTGPNEWEAFEDLRSVALENYEDATGQPVPIRPAARERAEARAAADASADDALASTAGTLNDTDLLGTQAEEGSEGVETAAPSPGWKNRLAALTPVQKFLAVEAAVVALAVLIAVPFFIFLIVRGPVQGGAPASYLSPRPLPGDLPFPAGMTLPGGWYFQLEKSTFVKGTWKPTTSEWLEGTELRRVVALPWNPQTEAVIRTFHPGDRVTIYLNNNDTINYKVDKIERVPVSDNSILTDSKPSLAIVLYQENAQQRWVVLCKP